jgi:integrase
MKNLGKPPAQVSRVRTALKKLEPSGRRMSARTRGRLDILRQPPVYRALFTLPERIFSEMRDRDQPTSQDAWACATALVLAVSFDTAFRRSNVVKLRIDLHLGAIDPATGRMPIVVPGTETKNGETYVSELRARTVRLVHEYLNKWRPMLGDGGSDYLFPPEGLGDAASERVALLRMARRVSRMVQSRLDIDFNLHLLRSLLATLYADAHPEDVRTAQVKLGHKTDSSTKRFYIDVDQRKANRRFDAIIDEIVEGAPRPKKKSDDV